MHHSLANVGESVQHGLANVGKSVQHGLANVGKSGEFLPSLLMNVGSSKIRSFYAQITYFICIKRSSLHSLNLPNLPNSRKTCQTCLSRVWRVRAARLGECQRVWQVRNISKKGHFGEYSNLLNSLASGHSLNKTQNRWTPLAIFPETHDPPLGILAKT